MMADGGTYYEGSVIRAFVPYGWKAFLGIDSEGKASEKKLHICKGADSELDIFSKVSVTVCFYSEDDFFFSPRGFYDDVADIEPVSIGDKTYTGYTCKSLGYPYTMLERHENGCVFFVMILEKNGDHVISISDSDVSAILESIERA